MRATPNKRAVIVGIFVFLGIAIFIITVLTLGSQRKTFANTVVIKSFFEDVNGLKQGNNVWFSGVKVGTIKSVNLIGNARVEVDMNIEHESLPYIRKNAKAKLSTDGLIGNKIIEIYGGTAKAPQIQEGDILNTDKLLSTDEMMATLSKNNDNLLAITDNFKKISTKMAAGEGSIGKLLSDETFADELNKTVVTLQKASSNLENLTSNVSNYTSRLNEKGGFANDLVTDTVIFSKLRSMVSQLQEVSDKSKDVMGNLQTATNTLNTGLTNKNAPAGMLLSDEKTAENLKITLQNLQSASKKLDEDLEAAQHNFLLRGFFKKKAKAEEKAKKDSASD
jgi:phospholipid/cholesterol/gamma-HCH transport system substrate-binding protein